MEPTPTNPNDTISTLVVCVQRLIRRAALIASNRPVTVVVKDDTCSKIGPFSVNFTNKTL